MTNLTYQPRTVGRWMLHHKVLGLLIRLGLTSACFVGLYCVSNLRGAVESASKADPVLLLIVVGILVARVPLGACRWRLLLPKSGPGIGVWRLTRILYVSTFLGLALPTANGNDVIRGFMLKSEKVPLDVTIGSIVLDRLLGIFALGLTVLVGTLFLECQHGRSLLPETMLATSGCFVILGILALAAPSFLLQRIAPSEMRQERNRWSVRLLGFLRLGLTVLSQTRSMLGCVLLSLLIALLGVLAVALTGRAAAINLPFYTYLSFVPVVWLVTMLPVAVSGIGLREASFAVLLGAVGGSYQQAITLGVLVSATGILAAAAGGVLLPFRTGAHKITSSQAEAG